MAMFADLKVSDDDTVETLGEKIARNEKKKKIFLALTIVLLVIIAAFIAADLAISFNGGYGDALFYVFMIVPIACMIAEGTLFRIYMYLKRNNTELLIAKKRLMMK